MGVEESGRCGCVFRLRGCFTGVGIGGERTTKPHNALYWNIVNRKHREQVVGSQVYEVIRELRRRPPSTISTCASSWRCCPQWNRPKRLSVGSTKSLRPHLFFPFSSHALNRQCKAVQSLCFLTVRLAFCRSAVSLHCWNLRYRDAETRHREFEGSIRAGRVLCFLLRGRCQRNRTYSGHQLLVSHLGDKWYCAI